MYLDPAPLSGGIMPECLLYSVNGMVDLVAGDGAFPSPFPASALISR